MLDSQMSESMAYNDLGENSKLGAITFDEGCNMFSNNISGLNHIDMSRISSPPEQYSQSKR